MKNYPHIIITQEMIDEANRLTSKVKVNRTVTSKIDTLTGILGEFAFAKYLFSDWEKHNVGHNKGEVDFKDIEIKTSAYPFRDTLNLLVREDYARKRKPPYYVQIIIDVDNKQADSIIEGAIAIIAGWASHEEIATAPKKDFGSKWGAKGGYMCFYKSIRDLHTMDGFKEKYFSK